MKVKLVVGIDENAHFFAHKITDKEELFNIIIQNYPDNIQNNVNINLHPYNEERVECDKCKHVKIKNTYDDEKEKRIKKWLEKMSEKTWIKLIEQSASRHCFEVIEMEI